LTILHKLTAVFEHLHSQIHKTRCKIFAGITAAQYVERLQQPRCLGLLITRQLFCRINDMDEAAWSTLKALDLGDILGVTGVAAAAGVGRTARLSRLCVTGFARGR